MKQVIHQNFLTDSNKVFCKRLDKVTDFNVNRCNTCNMCAGSLQGAGVECVWEDEDKNYPIMAITNPEAEAKRVKANPQIKKAIEITLKK